MPSFFNVHTHSRTYFTIFMKESLVLSACLSSGAISFSHFDFYFLS